MTNIINFNTRTADFSSPEDVYFPVSLQEFDVKYGADEIANANRFRAVVREDTNQVLAVHGADYNLVTNEEIFPQFEDAMRKSRVLDLTDMYTKVELNDDGASVVKSYHFPAHKVVIRGDDQVDMQLRVRNSYDGRWAFGTILGGYRLICTNGMVVGQKFLSTYGRHTKNLDIGKAVQKVDNAVQIYLDHQEVWQHWAGKRVMSSTVQTLLLDELKLPESFAKTILDQFEAEKDGLGSTIWALFNALTNWSTHHKIKKGAQRAVTQDNREKRVREIINSRGFLRLAA